MIPDKMWSVRTNTFIYHKIQAKNVFVRDIKRTVATIYLKYLDILRHQSFLTPTSAERPHGRP